MTEKAWLFVGASGRIGRMVMAQWRNSPPQGLRIVAQSRHAVVPDALHWAPISGPQAVLDWTRHHGPIAGMFAFAGVTPATGAVMSDNAALSLACLRAAAAAGIPRVLLASSSAVYGAGDGAALPETAPLHPANDYGRAKVEAEALCPAWRAKGLQVCCLRIGNVAGADALLLNVHKASADAPLRLDTFADGEGPLRSYIGPATLAQVLETLAKTDVLPDVLNLAAPRPVTMQSLVAQTGAAWIGTPAPATTHQRITMDCARLAALFPFSAAASDPRAMVAEWQSLKDPR